MQENKEENRLNGNELNKCKGIMVNYLTKMSKLKPAVKRQGLQGLGRKTIEVFVKYEGNPEDLNKLNIHLPTAKSPFKCSFGHGGFCFVLFICAVFYVVSICFVEGCDADGGVAPVAIAGVMFCFFGCFCRRRADRMDYREARKLTREVKKEMVQYMNQELKNELEKFSSPNSSGNLENNNYVELIVSNIVKENEMKYDNNNDFRTLNI